MAAPVPEIYVTSWHIPYSIIRKWPPANLVDPVRRRGLIPLTAVLLTISTAFVAARVYARVSKMAGKFGADDILIVAAWATGVVSAVGTFESVLIGGLDMHIWDAFLIGSKTGLTAWIQEFAFVLASTMTKISVLLFYRRLFFTAEPWKRRVFIDAAIAGIISYGMIILLFLILNCHPTAAYWESMDPNYSQDYKCVDRHIFDPFKGTVSVLSDAYALVLPQFLIWKLNLQCTSRWRLAFLFGCGWLATGAGIARTYYLTRLFTDPQRDLTWIGYDIHVWAQLESQLAIVCASVPVAIVSARNLPRWGRSGSNGAVSLTASPDELPDLEKAGNIEERGPVSKIKIKVHEIAVKIQTRSW